MKKNSDISKRPAAGEKPRRHKKILIAAILLLLLPMALAGAGVAGYAIWASGQRVDESLLPSASALPIFYDANGEEIGERTDPYVAAEEAPDALKNAFVATEDKRFYSHKGYDIVRIGGAIVKNIKAGRVAEGASTITQQLVKNTHLTHERSLARKLREIALAADLEKRHSKDEILSMYLSVIYFGSGAYGVKDAARTFFGKNIKELTLAECAALAGIVKNPAGYSPVKHPDACIKRRNVVLGLMREQGYITDAQYDEAKGEQLQTVGDKNAGADRGRELYLKLAKRQACEALGMTEYQLDNAGVRIYTCLDGEAQRALEEERENSSNFEGEDIMSVAVVKNAAGDVIALSSDLPYEARRQTGSVLKPLAVYAPALDMNAASLATPIVDERVDFSGFSPQNFDGVYYGETTVEDAIKRSMNSVSVKILDYIGLENSVRYLNSFGLEVGEEDKNYALALGSLSASPLDIAAAYSRIAMGGESGENRFVKYVVADGKKIEIETGGGRTLSPAAASLTTAALIQTVKDGTARTLSTLPFEVAAKTGTAERQDGKNSDGWIASYNDSFTVVVWHGSDSGMTERGGGYPARHARAIWQRLAARVEMNERIALRNVVKLEVDDYSAKKLKRVVLSSKNTPLEYRKSYYFDSASLPELTKGAFDDILDCELSAKVAEGHVELSFATMPVYAYRLYRTDVFGRALIYAADGDGNIARVRDVPIGFGCYIEYELICELKNNGDVNASSTKRVYFEPGYTMYGAA